MCPLPATPQAPRPASRPRARRLDDSELMSSEGQRRLYRKRARSYDTATKLYNVLGITIERYRRQAVDALALPRGGTVVDLGCGTGANFALLQKAVGPEGRILGVDLTPEMLERARERVRREGWRNVELIEEDMADFAPDRQVDGVLTTFALMLSPRQDAVVARAADMLRRDGRAVVLDFKEPPWPEWLTRLVLRLIRPYGAVRPMTERHPWELMSLRFGNCLMRDLYAGGIFIATSVRR